MFIYCILSYNYLKQDAKFPHLPQTHTFQHPTYIQGTFDSKICVGGTYYCLCVCDTEEVRAF